MKKMIFVALILCFWGFSPEVNAEITRYEKIKLGEILASLGVENRRDASNINDSRVHVNHVCQELGLLNCSSIPTISAAICEAYGDDSCFDSSVGTAVCSVAVNEMYVHPSQCRSIGFDIAFCNAAVEEGTDRDDVVCHHRVHFGQSLCILKGGTNCGWRMSSSDAIQILPNDVEWKWDQYNHRSRGRIWECRGTVTNRISRNSNCEGQPLVDNYWRDN